MLSRSILILFVLLMSCGPSREHPIIIPAGFPDPLIPERNPISVEGVELGRMLFYEPLLSSNGTTCASCHVQSLAFTDGKAVSNGDMQAGFSGRNSPTLANLAFMKHYFWDGGSRDLESQAFAPLMHSNEMDMDLGIMVERLNSHKTYPGLFKKVFREDSITSSLVVRALAQFQRSLISAQSKYDLSFEGGYELSSDEDKGRKIFNEHCAACHTPPLFTDNSFHNNGLDTAFSEIAEDLSQGRYRVTLKKEDLGKFRTPTLRNIEVTAPYMHDGRFSNLDEVLQHYNEGIRISTTLDTMLMEPMALTKKEMQDLKLFLLTLTDENFLQNPDYSNPF